MTLFVSYTCLATEEVVEESVPVTEGEAIATAPIALSIQDKWKLAKDADQVYAASL